MHKEKETSIQKIKPTIRLLSILQKNRDKGASVPFYEKGFLPPYLGGRRICAESSDILGIMIQRKF